MTRFYAAFAVVIAMTCSAVGITQLLDADPEHAAPPHRARPVAAQTAAVPLSAVGGESSEPIIAAVTAYVAGVLLEEQQQRERAEMDAQARAGDLRRSVPGSSASSSRSAPPQCDGIAWVIPVDIIIGESGCNFDATSPASFCGGNQCWGAYQFDSRHWTSGGCSDLGDWHDPEAQHECARRLSSGGTNLAPWGR